MRRTRIVFLSTLAFVAFAFALGAQNSLADRWRAIATEASGRVGVSALILESGQTASINASAHYPMQSVYKLPISMAVLEKVDEGQLALDQLIEVHPSDFVPEGKGSPLRDQFPQGTKKSIRDLLAYTLMQSDGTTSDVLMKLAGGPQAVTAYLRSLGVAEMVVANPEMTLDWKTQYDNWCTPAAAVETLVILENGKTLAAESRALILDDMQKAQTGLNRIRRLLPRGTTVADKTGTSGTQNGLTAATNDIALLTLPDGRHLALAIFVSDSKASDKTREDVIAKIARGAWDEWVPAK